MTIVGLPRTGKTTLARDLLKRLAAVSGCLFCNVQAENYFAGFTTADQVTADQILSGETVVWNCDPWAVKPKLLEIFLKQRAAETLNPITIFIDEAHLIASPGSFAFPEAGKVDQDNIIGVLCTTGNRWNIRIIWITQRPQFVDTGVYRTARYHVFFTVDFPDQEYFRRQGIIFDNPAWHDWVMVRS